jgi:hypothetical protein
MQIHQLGSKMRGGTINHNKIKAFNDLLYLLRILDIISVESVVDLHINTEYFNPLISSNKLFIEKFTN